MSIVEKAKEWLLSKALAKGVKAIVAAAIAWLAAQNGDDIISRFGLSIDWSKFEVAVTGLAIGGLTILLNWLKVRLGVKWL